MLSSRRGWRLLPCSLLAVGILLATGAEAQRVSSSPNFVGSGARALGMGGAFIAVADDATAASWNPGGLTQLERPEFSIVYSWKWFNEQFAETQHIIPDGMYSVDLDELNYMSFVYPIPWTLDGRNLVLSLNYQTKYDFDRSLSFRAQKATRNPNSIIPWTHVSGYIDFDQKGSLATLSPAAGIEITDKLSVGMAVNIWDSSLIGGNEWESVTKNRNVVSLIVPGGATSGAGTLATYEKYDNVSGLNYTFGALYKPTGRLSIGAVYHTAYSTDVDFTRSVATRGGVFGREEFTRLRIDWPASMGLGVAYRFAKDKLTLSLDVTRRNWDSFVKTFPTGERLSPLTDSDKSVSPAQSTYAVRLGGEYVFFNADKARQKILPSLRAGIFWDPQPATGRSITESGSITSADGDPDNFYGFAVGVGVLMYNRVNVDLAYEYRRGDKVRRDTLFNESLSNPTLISGFYENVEQHLLYLSTIVYF